MKNKKPVIALGALAAVALIGGTIAYFTSQVTFDNVFTTAVYKTRSEEVFNSPDNWAPGDVTPKTVTTTNEGTIPVAVRVSYTESWADEDGDPITTPPANAVTINLANTEDWTASNGYYYYKYALDPGQTTTSFMESVTLSADLTTTDACDTDTDTTNHTITKTCTTSIDGLGKATYTLRITVETVQKDQYANFWTGAPEIGDAKANTTPSTDPDPGNGD